MEIHQLRYFVEVVATGRFTQAAERCFVTQPTLSHQIKKLEDELGEPLLHRRKSGAVPTPYGALFYEHARRVLSEMQTATEEASAFRGTLKGSLRIGAIPTVAPYLLPSIIRSFLGKHPHLHIGVTEDVTKNLLEHLRTGDIDYALVSPPLPTDEWDLIRLPHDELLVTLPKKHPLTSCKAIDLEQLLKHPLVLMKEAHCLSHQALRVCAQDGRKPKVTIRSSQLETVQALVELGLGVSFTPAMALPHLSQRKVLHFSVAPKPVFREIALARFHDGRPTRAVEAFGQHVVELAKAQAPASAAKNRLRGTKKQA